MGYDSSDFGTTFKIDGDNFIISISKEGQSIIADLLNDIVSDVFHEKHSVVTNLQANGWFGLVEDNYMLSLLITAHLTKMGILTLLRLESILHFMIIC